MTEKTDLRILKTYHALIDAFEKMLEEQNYDDITVNSLCDFASIRRATFYKHFSDKLEFTDFAASCLHENISKTCHAKADLHTYLCMRRLFLSISSLTKRWWRICSAVRTCLP